MLPRILVIIGVTLIVWTLAFLYFRNYLRRRTGSKRILEEFQEEVDMLVAEINSATDRGLTLMEDRISSLKVLLEETDKRITVYQREIDRKKMHDHAYAEMGKRAVIKNDAPPVSIISEKNPSFSELKSAVRQESSSPAENIPPLSNEGPRFIRSSIRVEPKQAFAEQVIHLANAGFSVELIAKHLGTSIAEVELAAALPNKNNGEN